MPILILFAAFLSYLAFPNYFISTGCWPLGWCGLVFLFSPLENKDFWQRGLIGGVYGLIFYGLLVHWFIPYSLPGYLCFVLALSLQPVLFAIGYGYRPSRPIPEMLFVAGLWVGTECLRGLLMNGFSWGWATSQAFEPRMIQILAWTGAGGLGFVLVAGNFCLHQYLVQRRKRALALFLFFLGGIFIIGQCRLLWEDCRREYKPRLDILAVQPDIDFRLKKDISQLDSVIQGVLVLTRQGLDGADQAPDLIVWPETAWPADFRQYQNLSARMQVMLQEAGSPLLAGVALEEEGRDYNSAVLLAPQGFILKRYDKRYLVPFSEYVPTGYPGSRILQRAVGRSRFFHPGRGAPLFELDKGRPQEGLFHFAWGALICSEDTLGVLYREYKRKGAGFIIVLLNDGWFARPEALRLHAQIAVMHAAANRMPVLRVGNTGWTVFIDALGRLHETGNILLQEETFGHFRVWQDTKTTLYGFWGDWFCYLCLGFVIIGLVLRFKRKSTL